METVTDSNATSQPRRPAGCTPSPAWLAANAGWIESLSKIFGGDRVAAADFLWMRDSLRGEPDPAAS
jgi:hypothetical protein